MCQAFSSCVKTKSHCVPLRSIEKAFQSVCSLHLCRQGVEDNGCGNRFAVSNLFGRTVAFVAGRFVNWSPVVYLHFSPLGDLGDLLSVLAGS